MFGKKKQAPVITIFSAPNYCGKGNEAAYIFSEGEKPLEIMQFTEAKNKPYFMNSSKNVFTYYMVDIAVWVEEFIYVMFDWFEE